VGGLLETMLARLEFRFLSVCVSVTLTHVGLGPTGMSYRTLSFVYNVWD
jgi:hypothetical protein